MTLVFCLDYKHFSLIQFWTKVVNNRDDNIEWTMNQKRNYDKSVVGGVQGPRFYTCKNMIVLVLFTVCSE